MKQHLDTFSIIYLPTSADRFTDDHCVVNAFSEKIQPVLKLSSLEGKSVANGLQQVTLVKQPHAQSINQSIN